MGNKVTPIKGIYQDAAVVIANLADERDNIAYMIVVWVDNAGGYHLDRTPLTWGNCAALEAFVRQETFDLYGDWPDADDETPPGEGEPA